eukprot:SAG11_NODE_23019_length_396_cov_1.043771_1_plen_93_part_10
MALFLINIPCGLILSILHKVRHVRALVARRDSLTDDPRAALRHSYDLFRNGLATNQERYTLEQYIEEMRVGEVEVILSRIEGRNLTTRRRSTA